MPCIDERPRLLIGSTTAAAELPSIRGVVSGMEESLQHLEKSIAETWGHIDRQRHIIEVLEEHGHSQDMPTAEMMLQTLTASLEVLCERKASVLEEMQSAGSGTKPRLEWISK
jgi:hypothetical protein